MNLSDEIRKQIEKNKGLKLAVGEIDNHLSILENLVRKDIMEQVDEAYQRGLEDGKQIGVGAAELREKLEYQKGFEKGKDVRIKGCEGCMYQDTTIEHNPCNLCCNAFLNRWTAKDDKIDVGDEVADKDGDKTIVTSIHGDLFDGLCSDGSTMTDLFLEDNHKTGRHFDIAKILEEMKHD